MIILDMKKTASCETCPLHWNEQGMMCCGVTHDVVRENCPIKAEIPDSATNGDVIKAMFGDKLFGKSEGLMAVSCDWWNAKYKAESK